MNKEQIARCLLPARSPTMQQVQIVPRRSPWKRIAKTAYSGTDESDTESNFQARESSLSSDIPEPEHLYSPEDTVLPKQTNRFPESLRSAPTAAEQYILPIKKSFCPHFHLKRNPYMHHREYGMSHFISFCPK